MNSFYSELQIKDIEFATRNNLVDLLTELKRFKFVTSLVLGLKKNKKMMMRQSIKRFIRTLTETIINESDIDDVFE